MSLKRLRKNLWWWPGLVPIAMALAIAACGGGNGGNPLVTPTSGSPATRTTTPVANRATPTAATAGDRQGTSTEDIELLDEHWVALFDPVGRHAVYWNALVRNNGGDPVEVRTDINVLDHEGNLLITVRGMSWTLAPGSTLPVNAGASPLQEAAHRVEPTVRIDQIPEFRRERYGKVRFEGEILEFHFEWRASMWIVAEAEVHSVGTEGGPAFAHLAVYDAAGNLIAGVPAQGNLAELCPGESARLEVSQLLSTLPREFDAEGVTVRVFFSDVEHSPQFGPDCG